ncbi:MAG: hypothetical protein IPP74_12420 [Alphaproteobacteria bacterium]|nr:hypothetical protein [Alphaproteobacteria bacterium]
MARSYGTAAQLLVLKENTYGTPPSGNYEKMSFFSSSLGAEQPLINDAVLGLGREPHAPFRDVMKADGDLVVAVEPRDFGRWLQFLMGASTDVGVAATGSITFTANPSAGHTITLNGVIWTLVTSGASGNQTNIGANLNATLTQLATDLNASSNTSLTPASYTSGSGKLNITFKTNGATGNNFTLASGHANGMVSGPTLSGGGYIHTYISGIPTLPSFTAEVGHLNVPAYFVNTGCMLGSMDMDFQRSGSAKATLKIMAQGETLNTVSGGGTPTTRLYKPFSQFNGSILRNGVPLANITGAKFTYSNGLLIVPNLRPDALIDAIDPTQITINGSVDLRFADTTLLSDATNGNAIELQLQYQFPGLDGNNFLLNWTFHSVHLPRPKMPINGPGGVQASFNWQAAYNDNLSKSATVTLKNDVSAYA